MEKILEKEKSNQLKKGLAFCPKQNSKNAENKWNDQLFTKMEIIMFNACMFSTL